MPDHGLKKFLKERGLALSEAKTRIVHITEGFNFLGFHIRKFGKQGTLLTVPHKEKVLKHTRAIRSYLDAHKQTPTGHIIKELNPVIRGWANYYRHCAAKRVFQKVRHAQWQMLWTWAKRRHPNKSIGWVKRRYFKSDGYWTLFEGKAELVKPDKIPITRFVKITGRNSPYDPALRPLLDRAQEATSRTGNLPETTADAASEAGISMRSVSHPSLYPEKPWRRTILSSQAKAEPKT